MFSITLTLPFLAFASLVSLPCFYSLKIAFQTRLCNPMPPSAVIVNLDQKETEKTVTNPVAYINGNDLSSTVLILLLLGPRRKTTFFLTEL